MPAAIQRLLHHLRIVSTFPAFNAGNAVSISFRYELEMQLGIEADAHAANIAYNSEIAAVGI